MLANGDMSADPSVRIYDDIGDKKNMRFRYIGERTARVVRVGVLGEVR